jgi:hypothetical protein
MRKREIETLWDDIRLWLSDATSAAIKEAEDLTRRGRLKMELMRVSRDIEKNLTRLGSKVYARWSREPDSAIAADDELRKAVHEIARLEAELHTLQQEYDEEKREKKER